MSTKKYQFEATGGFDVSKLLKPETSALGNIVRFKLPDGRCAQLVVALEIESNGGEDYEIVTSEGEMHALGFGGLDYDELRFTDPEAVA